ncbi:MAG TPA: hypothetical protein VGM17_15225 [Rhizomicrobium sp.]
MSETAPTLDLKLLLERLVGQVCERNCTLPPAAVIALQSGGSGLGYSQLNELLLLLGFDRVTHSFFQFLVNGETAYQVGAAIKTMQQLADATDRFRKLSLLMYGNVKFGFKALSTNDALLEEMLEQNSPVELNVFHSRHDPIRPINTIAPEKTYYLGYVIERELRERLKNPDDTAAQAEEKERLSIVKIGTENHEAYLASDHLDVYVATSMRQRHEYVAVNKLTTEIFSHPELAELKLRWFDPTQAYCGNRIDKGLSEALMLRRAACTIYLVQETDTLGKDSELASTLAQGKPVIAFVPEVSDSFAHNLLAEFQALGTHESAQSFLLQQFEIFGPNLAWKDPNIRKWTDAPQSMPIEDGLKKLQQSIQRHYDTRARTLTETHPLGIQVNLATGVANGVLVVRTAGDCAKLVRRIITGTLEFEIEETQDAINLREKISRCIFRVMTREAMLMNAFWNFYLDPSE